MSLADLQQIASLEAELKTVARDLAATVEATRERLIDSGVTLFGEAMRSKGFSVSREIDLPTQWSAKKDSLIVSFQPSDKKDFASTHVTFGIGISTDGGKGVAEKHLIQAPRSLHASATFKVAGKEKNTEHADKIASLKSSIDSAKAEIAALNKGEFEYVVKKNWNSQTDKSTPGSGSHSTLAQALAEVLV